MSERTKRVRAHTIDNSPAIHRGTKAKILNEAREAGDRFRHCTGSSVALFAGLRIVSNRIPSPKVLGYFEAAASRTLKSDAHRSRVRRFGHSFRGIRAPPPDHKCNQSSYADDDSDHLRSRESG